MTPRVESGHVRRSCRSTIKPIEMPLKAERKTMKTSPKLIKLQKIERNIIKTRQKLTKMDPQKFENKYNHEECQLCEYQTNRECHHEITFHGKFGPKMPSSVRIDLPEGIIVSITNNSTTKQSAEVMKNLVKHIEKFLRNETEDFGQPAAAKTTSTYVVPVKPNESALGGHAGSEDAPKSSKAADLNTPDSSSTSFGCNNNHNKSEVCYLEPLNTQTDVRRISTTDARFPCNLCGNDFSLKCDLEDHIRMHTKEKPFFCTFCNYETSQQSHLQKHLRTHHQGKDEKKSVRQKSLRQESPPQEFVCNLCFTPLPSMTSLEKHIQAHTGEIIFRCHLCDYATAVRSDLTNHMKSHEPLGPDTKKVPKPFLCDYCDFQSTTTQQLLKHRATHLDDRPFHCPEAGCDYRAKRRDNLQGHVKRVHRRNDREKPFKCDLCPRKFFTAQHLRIHVNLHSK